MTPTEKAYTQFLESNTPFSLVKLSITKENDSMHEVGQIEKIIGDNFRQTTDMIFRGKHTYTVLMKNTCFDIAMAAIERLAVKLYHLNHFYQMSMGRPLLGASFDILGCAKEKKSIQHKHFDLNRALPKNTSYDELPDEIRTYLKCAKPLAEEKLQTVPKIDLMV